MTDVQAPRATVRLRSVLALPAGRLAQLRAESTRTSLDAICSELGIAPRVTGGAAPRIFLTSHAGQYRGPGEYFVGLRGIAHEDRAAKALELLAYAFNDYAARETARGREFLSYRPAPGRPSSGRALSAAEKMRRHRRRMGS